MKDGLCPKCGSNQIYLAERWLSRDDRATLAGLRLAYLDVYTCVTCGLVETYMPPSISREAIHQAWQYVGAAHPVALQRPDAARNTIRLPPMQFGTAAVLAYGPLDDRVRATGTRYVQMLDGRRVIPTYVAFYQYPNDSDIYRCYCDEQWAILQQQVFPSMTAAVAALEVDYQGAATLLIPFR